MNFYLTASHGGRIHFPINPERVSCEIGNRIMTWDVIQLGEIPRPQGREAVRYSFEGIFPGEARKNSTYVKNWLEPKTIVNILTGWLKQDLKMRLLITETSINSEVYFDGSGGFQYEWQGGHGDCYYSIRLVEAREAMIPVEKAAVAIKPAPKPAPAPVRPAPPPPAKTYTVKKGDTLWAIAKRFLGSGTKWPQIYNANKSVIGNNPNLIYPGQVYRIP